MSVSAFEIVSEKEKSQSIDNFDLADLSIMIESEKIIFPEKTKIGSTENIKIYVLNELVDLCQEEF